jgi:hypothetical protein
MAALMKHGDRCLNLIIDPGRGAIRRRFRAESDHIPKSPVSGRFKPIRPEGFCQRARQVKAIQRQNAAPLGLDPIDLRRVASIGHWKNALRIGAEQNVWIKRLRFSQQFLPG